MTKVKPINPTNTCSAVLVDDVDDIDHPPGAYSFYLRYGDAYDAPPKGMTFMCPCGCGLRQAVGFRPWESSPSWEFDGNQQSPTLSPSIDIIQHDETGARVGSHWHGYLENGIFRSC